MKLRLEYFSILLVTLVGACSSPKIDTYVPNSVTIISTTTILPNSRHRV